MKSLIKYTSYFLFALFCFVYFLPKESIYYEIEKYLKTENTIISNETIKEEALGIDISDNSLYFEEIKIADIKNIEFSTYIYATNLEIKEITLAKNLGIYAPLKIEKIDLSYNLLDFDNLDKIDLSAKGEFGVIDGQIDFINKVINISLEASKMMKEKTILLNNMKKGENEKYTYEYKF